MYLLEVAWIYYFPHTSISSVLLVNCCCLASFFLKILFLRKDALYVYSALELSFSISICSFFYSHFISLSKIVNLNIPKKTISIDHNLDAT